MRAPRNKIEMPRVMPPSSTAIASLRDFSNLFVNLVETGHVWHLCNSDFCANICLCGVWRSWETVTQRSFSLLGGNKKDWTTTEPPVPSTDLCWEIKTKTRAQFHEPQVGIQFEASTSVRDQQVGLPAKLPFSHTSISVIPWKREITIKKKQGRRKGRTVAIYWWFVVPKAWSDHVRKMMRCRKSARCCGTKQISKSVLENTRSADHVFEVQVPLRRKAHFEAKMVNTRSSDHCWRFRSRFASLRFTTLQHTTLHYFTPHYNTKLHCCTLDYTSLHATTLQTATTQLHSSTFHQTPVHSTTLHYPPPHYKLQIHNYTLLHSTRLRTTPLHSTTLH